MLDNNQANSAYEFRSELSSNLMKRLNLSNIMQVPRLSHVSLSVGCGKYFKDSKKMQFIFDQMKVISGQCPTRAKAKKSISQFGIREGMVVGIFVTLRKRAMYDFLDRLIYVAMPRMRDFRGMSVKGFDKKGNYNFGIESHDVFLEADDDLLLFGLNVSIATTANNDYNAYMLLSSMNVPFKDGDLLKNQSGESNG